MNRLSFLASLLAVFLPGVSLCAEYTKKDEFKLRTGDLVATVRPASAFTLGGIAWRGLPLAAANGHYGFVIAYTPGQFIGSGHTEGGKEAVESVELVEGGGTPVDLPPGLGRELEGGAWKLVKKSSLGEAVEIECTTLLEKDRLRCVHLMQVKSDCTLHLAYPFMFIWPATTTDYAAGLTNGQVVVGQFENQGWKVRSNARWMAVYSAGSGIGAVTLFPADFPAGDEGGHRHTFWDLPSYHKQYFQFAHGRRFQAGEEYRFEVELFPFEASPENWKASVAALLKEHEVDVEIP